MTLFLKRVFLREFVGEIWLQYQERLEQLRIEKLENDSALMLQHNYRRMMARQSKTIDGRVRNLLRYSLLFQNSIYHDNSAVASVAIVQRFLQATATRSGLKRKLQSFPAYIDRWKQKAKRVRDSVHMRFAVLKGLFERELKIMVRYYGSKSKKQSKKTLLKLQNIKPHNMEKMISDYFWGVCYAFYKRQMQIWVLLRHKYLRTSAVEVHERRFQFKPVIPMAEHLDEERTASPDEELSKYPVYFSEKESESVIELTQAITEKLTHLLRGTTEAPPVGSLGDIGSMFDTKKRGSKIFADSPVKKSMVSGGPDEDAKEEARTLAKPANVYKEMGLTSDRTSLMKKLQETFGLAQKKGKRDTLSPKGQKTKGASGKSASKKRSGAAAVSESAIALANKRFLV